MDKQGEKIKWGVITPVGDRKAVWGMRSATWESVIDIKDTDIFDVTIFDSMRSADIFYRECVVYRGIQASKVSVGYEL